MPRLYSSRSCLVLTVTIALFGCSRLPGDQAAEHDAADTPTTVATEPAIQAPPEPVTTAPVETIANTYCSIDSPKPDSVHQLTAALPIWGWAFDRVSGNVPDDISIRISSTVSQTSRTIKMERGPRPDVAAVFRLASVQNSGFGGQADLSDLPAGIYTATVLQRIGESTYSCSNGSTFALQ